jgi:hypothetical protein
MRLWRELKYSLLLWLLGDVCRKSPNECESCILNCQFELAGFDGEASIHIPGCREQEVLYQARKVWDLED